MSYIRGTACSFGFSGEPDELFTDLSFTVDSHSRVGLVGRNGSGKTTLLRILGNYLTPTGGCLFRRSGLRVGYLAQDLRFADAPTGTAFLWTVRPDLAAMKGEMTALESGIHPLEAFSVYDEFSLAGGYDFAHRLSKVAAEFAFSPDQLERPLDQLSSGEKTRLGLAALMLAEPDLLLLDEPTNHLDVAALTWLERYLAGISVPFVLISHDRSFLDACVEEIWELEKGSLRRFSGNYSFYRQEKDQEYARASLEHETQQRKIRQLRTAARDRRQWSFSHQPQTGREGYAPVYESINNFAKSSMKRAKILEKRIETMIDREEAKKPWVEKKRHISFTIHDEQNLPFVLRLFGVRKCFDHELFPEVNLGVRRGSRLAVVGPNGSGKTTLLRIIMGLLAPTAGRVTMPPALCCAYYAQECEQRNPDTTIIDEVLDGDLTRQTLCRTTLGCLGITGEKVNQRLSTLSLGERSKVALARTILSGAQLLVLDEPTNHLEIQAREAVEEALSGFPGAVVFVSHDRRFLDNLATQFYDLQLGRLV